MIRAAVSHEHLEDRRRAPRFELNVPVKYRRAGDLEWLEGASENISSAGIQFVGAASLERDTFIELSFPLKSAGSGTTVLCQGYVVRATPAAPSSSTRIAVSIRHYRFVRERPADSATAAPVR